MQEQPPPPDVIDDDPQYGSAGTILEAAFVDPAYQWPPPDGVGKNAIELQASVNMMDDTDSVRTTPEQKERMSFPPKPDLEYKVRWWNCCRKDAVVELQEYEQAKKAALAARKEHYAEKKARVKQLRRKNRYNRVPEGILIYRLDTATQTLSLMSEPHSKTDTDALVQEMVVASVRSSPDRSRRGMLLTGSDGTVVTLVACEQRTAIAWLEAMDMMLANRPRMGENVGSSSISSTRSVDDDDDEVAVVAEAIQLHHSSLSFPLPFCLSFVSVVPKVQQGLEQKQLVWTRIGPNRGTVPQPGQLFQQTHSRQQKGQQEERHLLQH